MLGRLLTILLLLAGSAVFALATPGTASACDCAVPMTSEKTPQVFADLAGTGAVFLGVPTSASTPSDAQGYSIDIVEFEVTGVLDGKVDPITTVSTNTHTTACGAGFTVGAEYLVAAGTQNTNGAQWSAASCGGTSFATDRVSLESAISVFGQPRPVVSNEPPEPLAIEQNSEGMPYIPWIVALISASAASVAIWLARRRPTKM